MDIAGKDIDVVYKVSTRRVQKFINFNALKSTT
jgi:hypothetical protein